MCVQNYLVFTDVSDIAVSPVRQIDTSALQCVTRWFAFTVFFLAYVREVPFGIFAGTLTALNNSFSLVSLILFIIVHDSLVLSGSLNFYLPALCDAKQTL